MRSPAHRIHIVTKTNSGHLRLFSDGETAVAPAPVHAIDRIDRLCRAFAGVAGRPLEVAVDGGRRELRLGGPYVDAGPAAAAPPETVELAAALEDIVAELHRTQRALREREAELAAGIPVAAKVQPQRHLVERLESVLRAAAEALGCKAAAAYLLDDATTELKLRAAWGLPDDRLMEPARALRGAKADLEALAGHAVALEDATLFPHWNLPEPTRPAAVCVPIATPTELLGTLWVFADEKRPFSDHEVNLVELSAGRIAADLEREVLLGETRQRDDLRRDWDEAVQHRRVREPQVAPLVDGWEMTGTLQAPDDSLGEFYDWLVPDDGVPTVAVGRVEEKGFAAALGVESLRSAWRAHVHHEHDLPRLLERVNDDLWGSAVEPSPAHLLGVRMETDGTLRWAGGGRSSALWLPSDEATAVQLREGLASPMHELWRGAELALGVDSEFAAVCGSRRLLLGERLLLANDPRLLEQIAAWLDAGNGELPYFDTGRKWLSYVVSQMQRRHAEAMVGPLVMLRRTR
jgi:hypothetical protein